MQELCPRHASSGRTRPGSRESRLRNPCRPVLGPYGHTPEQILNKLRQTAVEIAQGATVAQVLLERWRRHYNTEKTRSSLERNLRFLRLDRTSPAWTIPGFQQIPFEDIGIIPQPKNKKIP